VKTRPVVPARIAFDGGLPHAPDFGDVYHARIGALAQARHVFLGGNRLPGRWAGRERFVVLETGFGLGHNFLATWDAWRHDPARCERLFFVAVDRHPPCVDDLRRAHVGSELPELARELVDAWPALTPNLHPLEFEGGRVRLLLGFGDACELLPALECRADAFFLDGFAPARNPEMWTPQLMEQLARHAAPGASVATWSVARAVRDGLARVGFELSAAPGIGGKREITVGRFAPRFVPPPPAWLGAAVPWAREAVVVGAGLAGAAAAMQLARLGLAVRVLERHAAPAGETSGNPAGLFHGTLHPDDGAHARWFRAAALAAARALRPAVAAGAVAGAVDGLLRLDSAPIAAMRELASRLGLPAAYAEPLDDAAASALAGRPLPSPAWLYRDAGWVAPAALVTHWLATPGVRFEGGAAAASVERTADGWRVLDDAGRTLAEAPLLVLANAADAPRLAARWLEPQEEEAPWPLSPNRGQVSGWHGPPEALHLPVAGGGYALALPPSLGGGLLCGATEDPGDPHAQLRDADHLRNFARLERITGLVPPQDRSRWFGRVGWRLQSADRLPVVGALAAAADATGGRPLTQPSQRGRLPGLFVLTALGGRGITLAPLAGALVAAQATGTPWPVERDLASAVDPLRWQVRRSRRAGLQNP
jgi:tRNA 5-methylaminomethyl-2-thiouridine biosynthesis bifunctional protein